MAAELGDYRTVMRAGGAEFDSARVGFRIADSHCQVVQFLGFAQALEPFHRGDAGRKQIFAKTQVIETGFIEAVEVDMEERQAPVMLLNERESRAQNVLFAQREPMRQPLDEAGLARAELADEAEQLAPFQERGQAAAPCLGFV